MFYVFSFPSSCSCDIEEREVLLACWTASPVILLGTSSGLPSLISLGLLPVVPPPYGPDKDASALPNFVLHVVVVGRPMPLFSVIPYIFKFLICVLAAFNAFVFKVNQWSTFDEKQLTGQPFMQLKTTQLSYKTKYTPVWYGHLDHSAFKMFKARGYNILLRLDPLHGLYLQRDFQCIISTRITHLLNIPVHTDAA